VKLFNIGNIMKKILLTSILYSSTLFSTNTPNNTYSYEVTPFISGILTDSKSGLKDDNYINAGISLGRNLKDSFFNQVEIAYMRSNNLGYKDSNGNTNANRLFINAVKKYALSEKLSAYGILGAGYQNITHESDDFKDSPLINYGLGLRYDIARYGIAIKGDVRHLISTKDNQNNIMYTFGLAMPLGRRSSEVIMATVPIVNEQSIMASIDWDDDKDGVLNSKDLCLDTINDRKVNKNGCEINNDNKDSILNNFYR
jgi:OmpA-OmpF porin, OOP family